MKFKKAVALMLTAIAAFGTAVIGDVIQKAC